MRRTLVAMALSAVLLVALGCSSTSSPTPCGSETCSGDQVCLQPCHEDGCSMDMPAGGTCPAGYIAETGSTGVCCGHAAPPSHCVVPSEATPQDCAPYGQLMFRQANDPNAPPVFCGCLV